MSTGFVGAIIIAARYFLSAKQHAYDRHFHPIRDQPGNGYPESLP
jgi:hypothetical protein